MRKRRTSLAASLLSLVLSAAALAQDAPVNHFAQPHLFTQPDSVPAEQSSILNGTSPDAWNLDWQWRFQADAIYMKRNRDWNDIPVITGPETFRPSNLGFDYKAGTRLSLGIMHEDFEMDFVFTTINDWTASQSGVLANAVDFDGPTAYGAAIGAAQTTVDPGGTPNYITSSTYFSPINTAALTGAESNELEFLKPGAKYSQSYNTGYQDFEVNYKRRSQPGRFARFGFGYRNVQFDESGRTALQGTFDTVDSATGLEAGPNNGLANGSLISGGLTVPNLAAQQVGFSENSTVVPAIPADELLFTSNLRATNHLNGVQVTSDFLLFESDYFELGAFGKAGVFHNFASGRLNESYTDTLNDSASYTRTLSSSKQVASFLGQAGLTGRIFLRENVRLFGSYEALYLSGLALAPDQMRGISTTVTPAATLDLRTQGSVFIHGGRVGVEILWP
jgi:hypothetical protein